MVAYIFSIYLKPVLYNWYLVSWHDVTKLGEFYDGGLWGNLSFFCRIELKFCSMLYKINVDTHHESFSSKNQVIKQLSPKSLWQTYMKLTVESSQDDSNKWLYHKVRRWDKNIFEKTNVPLNFASLSLNSCPALQSQWVSSKIDVSRVWLHAEITISNMNITQYFTSWQLQTRQTIHGRMPRQYNHSLEYHRRSQ